MERGDFAEAERQLAVADSAAPGFPETNAARSELSRRRIAAETEQEQIAVLLGAIDRAFQERRFDDADRAIEDGRRRYGSYTAWVELQRRAAEARQGNDRQAAEQQAKNARAIELASAARTSAARGDIAAAERSLGEAAALAPGQPEVAIARAEVERAKADRARMDAEARAIAASVDAALARNRYDDAERLLGEGSKRYPGYAGWPDLTRKLTDERRAASTQPATPSPPATAPSPPPTQTQTPPPATPSANPPAPKAESAAGLESNAALTRLVRAGHDALDRHDLPAAEKATAEAEKIDPKAKAVIELRAAVKAAATPVVVPAKPVVAPTDARTVALVATARKAMEHSDFVEAEKAVAEAEKLDAAATVVVDVRADLKALKEKHDTHKPGERGPRN